MSASRRPLLPQRIASLPSHRMDYTYSSSFGHTGQTPRTEHTERGGAKKFMATVSAQYTTAAWHWHWHIAALSSGGACEPRVSGSGARAPTAPGGGAVLYVARQHQPPARVLHHTCVCTIHVQMRWVDRRHGRHKSRSVAVPLYVCAAGQQLCSRYVHTHTHTRCMPTSAS